MQLAFIGGIFLIPYLVVFLILRKSVDQKTRDYENSRAILEMTTTNNDLGPFSEVLEWLPDDLEFSMEGYMP